ncbi:MAG: DUF1573 domain-containing protein, partial [Saprospiraceae bacterium]|nr:DUF1573 domain-containing protein [Saprospiraceae bacterium]
MNLISGRLFFSILSFTFMLILVSCQSEKEVQRELAPKQKTEAPGPTSDKNDSLKVDSKKEEIEVDGESSATWDGESSATQAGESSWSADGEKDKKKKAEVKKKTKAKPALMKFNETLHNYGKIEQGDVISYSFKFENAGGKELTIKEVRASCGCTQPSYPFLPILPGEEGTIGVR